MKKDLLQDEYFRTDGSGREFLRVLKGGSSNPFKKGDVFGGDECFARQDGKTVFKNAVFNMADVSERILKRNNLTKHDLNWLAAHQANKRIIDAVTSRIGLEESQVMINIEKYGNTTSATLPLLLADYESQLKKGDIIVFAAFGGGFSWGSILFKWAYNSN